MKWKLVIYWLNLIGYKVKNNAILHLYKWLKNKKTKTI